MKNANNWFYLLYDKAINGVPKISKSVEELVEDYISKSPSKEVAIKKLVKNQISKCTTSGFVTGFGGLLTLPVTLSANVTSVLYVQLRMVAAIAKIYGYDIHSDQVQTRCYNCLVGSQVVTPAKHTGIKVSKQLAESVLKKKVPGKMLQKVNKKVGFRLLTKSGGKGTIILSKGIPFVGALVGGAIDNIETRIIANRAIKEFKPEEKECPSKFLR